MVAMFRTLPRLNRPMSEANQKSRARAANPNAIEVPTSKGRTILGEPKSSDTGAAFVSTKERLAPLRNAERYTARALKALDEASNINELDHETSKIKRDFVRVFIESKKDVPAKNRIEISKLGNILAVRTKERYRYFQKIMDKNINLLSDVFNKIDHPDGDRAITLRKFVAGIGLSHLLVPENQTSLALQAEISSPSLPTEAPAIFRERASKSENAPTFIQRVYGKWLTGEFTRADLRRLDESAATGLKNWERLHGKSDLNLPTVIERNDRKLADLAATSGNAGAEISRLRSALIRRQRKPK